MDVVVTVRVTVAKEPTNEARAWRPGRDEVAVEIEEALKGRDLDTGWLIVGVD